MVQSTIETNPSGSPIQLGSLPPEIILDPEAIAEHADEPGIRLWHIKSDEHDFRCVSDKDGCDVGHNGDGWYRFYGHQTVVETMEEAKWLMRTAERIFHEPVIFTDDLAVSAPCLACRVKGKEFSTRCMAMYQAHMFLEHI